MEGEMLKGHLDLIVLAALSSGPAHGYAVIEEIRRKSGRAFNLPEGTIYPALHRLEAFLSFLTCPDHISNLSEWTGTALASRCLSQISSNCRLRRAVQARGERNAIVHSITYRSDPDCGMLSSHPCGECFSPITSAGSFYFRARLVGSKA